MLEALYAATTALPQEVKNLIHAVNLRGKVLARGTWDGCVFNAITGMKSTDECANVLNMDEHDVANFILHWDQSTKVVPSDIEANRILMDMIAGVPVDKIKRDPYSAIKSIRTVSVYHNEEWAKQAAEMAELVASFTDVEEDKTDFQVSVENFERALVPA